MRDGQLVLLIALSLFGQQCKSVRLPPVPPIFVSFSRRKAKTTNEKQGAHHCVLQMMQISEPTYCADATVIHRTRNRLQVVSSRK
jgi:hypothetical protein